MFSATAQVWWVCSTTRAPQMRWMGAWMHCADNSTTPSPSSVLPDSSNTIMSRARASDQCRPKGRIRCWPSRPGTVTVKWLSMPSSSSCSTARRWAAARWIFAWVTGSTARRGWTDMTDLSAWIVGLQYSEPCPFGAEMRHGEDQRRSLQRGAEVERRADAPVALRQVRHQRQQRRAQHRRDHRHQAVESAHGAQRLPLAARIGGARNNALDGSRNR